MSHFFFGGYNRFGTFNLFTDSGNLSTDIERLLYTYSRNLLPHFDPGSTTDIDLSKVRTVAERAELRRKASKKLKKR